MDNSKYLALVDLLGNEGANQVREKAAEFLAGLDCEFRPEIRQDCGDGLDAVRWAGDGTVWVSDPLPSWHDVPILSSPLETELVTLPWWRCEYCGSINSSEALYCGQCGPSHCGAPKPGCDEPPRAVLHLREFSSFYVVDEPEEPVDFYADYPRPDSYFYPSNTGVTLAEWREARKARRTFEDFKLELGTRLLSAFQKAIRGAMSLC